jgi:hypothetical protein
MVRIRRHNLKPIFESDEELTYRNIGTTRRIEIVLKTYNLISKFKIVEVVFRDNKKNDEVIVKYKFNGSINDLKQDFKKKLKKIIDLDNKDL